MGGISQTTFSDAFSWMKSFVYWSKFHWSLFLALVKMMAWRRIGAKPLSETMPTVFIDAYMRHSGWGWGGVQHWCRECITLMPWQNGRYFADDIYKAFLEWKCVYLIENLTEICSQGPSWQCISTGSYSGLAPSRQQAIIWTDEDLVPWRICHPASMTNVHIYDS